MIMHHILNILRQTFTTFATFSPQNKSFIPRRENDYLFSSLPNESKQKFTDFSKTN